MRNASEKTYLWQLMTPVSRLCWLAWRFARRRRLPGADPSLSVKLTEGPILNVRDKTWDGIVAREVFLERHYNKPWLSVDAGKWVIDLGGNVGYATLDFAFRWPGCRVLTVEPIPEHIHAINRHVEANGLADRVEVLEAAAGVENGTMSMVSDGICSRAGDGATDEIEVAVVDVFERLADRQPIGLLKVDVEGAEFSLLKDERLAALSIDALIVEWHDYGTVESPREVACELVERAGFEIVEEVPNPPHGMIYASRRREGQAEAPRPNAA